MQQSLCGKQSFPAIVAVLALVTEINTLTLQPRVDSLQPSITNSSFRQKAQSFDFPDELSNANCANVVITGNTVQAWNDADGNKALHQFEDIFNNDKVICEACYGMTVAECQHKDVNACNVTLKQNVYNTSTGEARWDRALGIYTQASSPFNCGSSFTSSCGQANCAMVQNNSGSYVLLESMVMLHAWMQSLHTALDSAHDKTQGNAAKFGEVFVPIPSLKDKRLDLGIGMAALSGILGIIPGIGGLAALGGGIAGAAANNVFANQAEDTSKAPDLTSPLEQISEQLLTGLYAVSDTMFRNGTDKDAKIDAPSLIENGTALSARTPSDFDQQLADSYAKIIFQKMAVHSWEYMQKDGVRHYPFITFAPGGCGDLDYGNRKSVPFMGLDTKDSSITYQGSCYWLLDMQATHEYGNGQSDSYKCSNPQTLPGGTHKSMNDNREHFGGLSIADFIIPSVRGWINNGRNNNFNLKGGGDVTHDPQDAGALNITVCDYLTDFGLNPGSGCVTYNSEQNQQTKECAIEGLYTEPINALIEYTTGDWMPGTCKISWYWYNSGAEWDGVNPIRNGYQLHMTVHDAYSRVIGNFAKEFVSHPIEWTNTALPYIIYVGIPGVDNKEAPLEFWYENQHWTSDATDAPWSCIGGSGGFGGENKQGHCIFSCPDVDANAPKESDVHRDHALPAPPYQTPIPFGPMTIHHYPAIREEPKEPDRTGAKADYQKAQECFVRVTQYWFGTDNIDNYQYEAYVGPDIPKQPPQYYNAEWNGQIPANLDVPNKIYGLNGDLSVTFRIDRNSPMEFLWKPAVGDKAGQLFSFKSWDKKQDDRTYFCNEELGWDKFQKRQIWCVIHDC